MGTNSSKGKVPGKTPVADVSRMPKVRKEVIIPSLKQEEIILKIIGDRPLMVCNKMSVAADIAERYDTPTGGNVPKQKDTPDEAYQKAFYVMPDSPHPAPHVKAFYGIPASGIKKCANAAIRQTGITDNITIGRIQKGFFVLADGGGLCRLHFKKLERDIRPVNIGSGQKTVPSMRHRPMFHGWWVNVRMRYNPRVLGPEALVNLFMYAGAYIGLHEMRAQKMQGECGGFVVETV